MEPLPGPSVSPKAHNKWKVAFARKAAEEVSAPIKLCSGRACEVFLHREAYDGLDKKDLDRVLNAIAEEQGLCPEVRSHWLDLDVPLHRFGERLRRQIEVLQIKGTVFDSRCEPLPYSGVGWRPEYYFADGDARFQRYHPQKDAVGSCFFEEAIKEFDYLLKAFPRFVNASVTVPAPIGWGAFPDRVFEGFELGFVILGLPAHGPRGAGFYTAFDALLQGNPDWMSNYLFRRSQAIRCFHDSGFLLPFRHVHNISETNDGAILMHDLGDSCALRVEHMFSEDQFIAEAFANVAFAVAPREHVVDNAARFEEVRKVVHDRLPFFFRESLAGYFGHFDSVWTFEDFEAAFRAAFGSPFQCLENVSAKAFRSLFDKCTFIGGGL
jgi:hypothetical protein